MEDKDKTLEFIEDYRYYQLLWDPNLIDYTNKSRRQYALSALASKYEVSMKAVKNKIKNLRSYFSKEHQRVFYKRRERSSRNFVSSWFAYKPMLFILDAMQKENRLDNMIVDPEEAAKRKIEANNRKTQEFQLGPPEPPPSKDKPSKTPQDHTKVIDNQTIPLADGSAILILDDDQPPVKRPTPEMAAKDSQLKCVCAKRRLEARDEYTVFGQLIAYKLRGMSARNKIVAQKRISAVFFDLELEQFDLSTEQKTVTETVLSKPPQPPPEPKMDEAMVIPDVYQNDVLSLDLAGVASYTPQPNADVPSLSTMYPFTVHPMDFSQESNQIPPETVPSKDEAKDEFVNTQVLDNGCSEPMFIRVVSTGNLM